MALPPKLQLPLFDCSGSIDLVIQKYESLAIVQGLSKKCKINHLFAQLEGWAAKLYVWTTQGHPHHLEGH